MQGEGVTRMCSTLLSRGLSLNSHEPTRTHTHTLKHTQNSCKSPPPKAGGQIYAFYTLSCCEFNVRTLREVCVCVCGCTRAVSERIDGVRNVKNLQTLWYVFVCMQRTEFWYDSIYRYSETSIVWHLCISQYKFYIVILLYCQTDFMIVRVLIIY